MAAETISPYGGGEPYLFISYAHKNGECVRAILAGLYGAKYRFWYDEGIEAGANWPQTVAEKLRDSDTVLIFLSAAAIASQNCRREIHYAVAQKKKMLVVRLEPCEVPAELAMQLSVVPTLDVTDAEDTVRALTERLDPALIGDGVTGYGTTRAKASRKVNPWFIVSLALALLGATLALFLWRSFTGRVPGVGIEQQTVVLPAPDEGREVTVTRFNDGITMEIVLNSLDSEAVFLCGNCVVSDASAIRRETVGWSVLGETVPRGDVKKLDDFTGASQLALVNESLTSLEGIEKLDHLTYLDLSDNPVTDLTPLAVLERLETLVLLDLPAEADLAPLAKIPNLKRVYLSADAVQRAGALLETDMDVIVRRAR